ncbi:polysaccharide lyase family 3 protein [Collybiopsis luxurians FD-317 M1]|uniref:Pectate lyase n=1 Tax=Collybiopsis luxurians FD-317 M1 TaxID=944289 RepID=A0A0D0B6V4_9AGAR|nr:polysaccharide lyase family 3 protein [Collybiopsis luxurians FD-317 M1]
MFKFTASLLLLVALVAANPTRVENSKRTATDQWPTAPLTSSLSKAVTIAAGQTFTPSQAYTRYDRGSGACKGQSEGGDSDAVFLLEEGATLSHVIIGANQAEGVHCLGSCTLDHVYFEDVCEDAITIKQSSGTSRINYGGAKHAEDKVVQHNGGGLVIINSFYVEDFGKLYRSCGNCDSQVKRQVQINDVWAVDGDVLVGINTNYGDTATIRTTKADSVDTICEKYTGNDNGDEPKEIGSGPDSTNCLYSSSDITS